MKYLGWDTKVIMEISIDRWGMYILQEDEMMRVAIITGATSGIGREAAIQIDRRFKSLDEIWIIGRREEKLLSLQKKLKHSTRTFVMDVTDERDIREFEDFLYKANPNIRMLFQSAGQGLHGRFDEMTCDDQVAMIRLNCEALTTITSMCLPFMRKDSHIIHLASSAGMLPFPGYSVYGASKAYVLNFSRALRAELKKRKIHVLAVCPGPVNTPFFDVSERYASGLSPFKKAVMNTPEAVVRKALGDAALHRAVSVDTPAIALFRFGVKIVPQDIVTNILSYFL